MTKSDFYLKGFLGEIKVYENTSNKILPFLCQVDILSSIQRNKAIYKWQ